MFSIKYDTPYKSSNGYFDQIHADHIVTPDGRHLYAHRDYLNKLFRDSGYISTNAMNHAYILVGDKEEKMKSLSFEGTILASASDEFVYFRSDKACNNFLDLMKSLNNFGGSLLCGDFDDLKDFSVIVHNEVRDLIFEISVSKEYLWVYQGKVNSLDIIIPVVLYRDDLSSDELLDKVKEILISDTHFDATPPRFLEEISVAEARDLLVKSGIIHKAKKSKNYELSESLQNVYYGLESTVELINQTSYGKSFYTSAGNSSNIIEPLTELYNGKVQSVKNFGSGEIDENYFNMSLFLWAYANWKSIE